LLDDGVDEFEEDFMSQGVPTPGTESPSGIKRLEDNSLYPEITLLFFDGIMSVFCITNDLFLVVSNCVNYAYSFWCFLIFRESILWCCLTVIVPFILNVESNCCT